MSATPGDDPIDQAIVRVRAGDREAFRTVITACEAPLRVLVAAILPQVAAVDDVVQKSLVTAYFRLDQYTVGTSFMAWVATIARYQALNERRRWLAEHAFKQRLRGERRLDQALHAGDEVSPFADERLLGRLGDCLACLRDLPAAIVRAHYLEQVPVAELAARHGRSADWVHLVLHRARRALRTCLIAKAGGQLAGLADGDAEGAVHGA